jgi:hypothetical protein
MSGDIGLLSLYTAGESAKERTEETDLFPRRSDSEKIGHLVK